MMRTLFTTTALAGALFATTAMAQQTTTKPLERGQGTSVTGTNQQPNNSSANVGAPSASTTDSTVTNPDANSSGLQRGQGTSVTGGTELAKDPIPNSTPYNEDPNNVIGKGPIVGGSGPVAKIPGQPTPGQISGTQVGQGTSATGSSELSGKSTTAPGQ